MTENAVFDPYDGFAELAGAERDPYPGFAERRRSCPVWKGSLVPPEMVPPQFRVEHPYHCFRYDDCARVLRDAKTFSSECYDYTIGMVMGRTILGMGGQEHKVHRGLVSNAFRERSLARWQPEMVEPICHQLVDRFAGRGQAELVRQLTFDFPVRVIARLLGLPEEDYQDFQRLSTELIGIAADIERGLAASEQLKEYLSHLVADRRREPREDIISDLVTAEVDGEALDDEAIYSFLRLLLPAGVETTYRSAGNLLFLLLTHPEQLEAVRADRSLIPQAIEEGLRCEPPILSIQRIVTTETEVAGVAIPAGAGMNPWLGSANHDETRWDDPDRFDIFRPYLPHLVFGHGPHLCLGMHLARLETRVLVNVVLDRLPDLRLRADEEDPHIRGLLFRSPNRLPVEFAAA